MRSLAERSHRQHAESWLHERAQTANYDAADAVAAANSPIANDEPFEHGNGHVDVAADDAARSSRSAADDDAAIVDAALDDLQLLAIALSKPCIIAFNSCLHSRHFTQISTKNHK